MKIEFVFLLALGACVAVEGAAAAAAAANEKIPWCGPKAQWTEICEEKSQTKDDNDACIAYYDSNLGPCLQDRWHNQFTTCNVWGCENCYIGEVCDSFLYFFGLCTGGWKCPEMPEHDWNGWCGTKDQWAEKCESFELNGGDYEEGDGYDGCLDKYDSNPDLGPCPQNDYHDVELAFQENQDTNEGGSSNYGGISGAPSAISRTL